MIPGRLGRLPGWDYRRPGWYLITIVVAGRRDLLAMVRDGATHPSRIGRTVISAWEETLPSRPWVSCAAVVFMPDHVHAVVGWHAAPERRDARLGKLVQQFKGLSAAWIHTSRMLPTWDRLWQAGFHDRIIRSRRHLESAVRYVRENPKRHEDRRRNGDAQQ